MDNIELTKNDFSKYDYLDKYDFGIMKVTKNYYDTELYPNKVEALKKYVSLYYGYFNGDTKEVTLDLVFTLLKNVALKISKFEKNTFSVFFYWYGEVMMFEESQKIFGANNTRKELSHIEIMIKTLIDFLAYGFPFRDDKGNLKYGLTEEMLKIDPWELDKYEII